MDQALLRFFNETLANPVLDGVMIIITTAGLAAFPVIACVMIASPRNRRTGVVLLLAMLATLMVTVAAQALVGRPRPAAVRLILPLPDFFAFPSGHASVAWCAAALLSLACRARRVQVAVVLGAGLVSISRLFLGHHYPSDVIGGGVLGLATGALFYGLWLEPRQYRGQRLRWVLWPQVAIILIATLMAYKGLIPRFLGHPHLDKVGHFLMFGLAAFWLHLWLRGRRVRLWRARLPLGLLILASCALAEEVAQALSPRRNADLADATCDLVGMLLFTFLADRLLGWMSRRSGQAEEAGVR